MVRKTTRVAVVDDDASVRKALRRLLQSAAFDVEAYGSGAELFDELDAFRPSCIVLDLHMQGLNGLDVQRHLARIGSRTPVIIITGHESARSRDETMALGASEYLAKPIDAEVLIAAIRRAVRAAQTPSIG